MIRFNTCNVRELLTLLLIFAALTSAAQSQIFTLDDSLRGTITPERSWWDVSYYHLNLNIDAEYKRINGNVMVRYKVLRPAQILQLDLQPPLVIDSVLQNDEVLSFQRKGRNAYMISLKKLQSENNFEQVNVYYSGQPIIARNPPWEGGFQFTKDLQGNHFIATSCQGLGASAWWPNKDHSYDEPDSMLMTITVPDPLIDVSNGRLRETIKNNNGTTTYNWFVGNPINNYGVNVNAGTYAHFSDTLQGEGGELDLDFYVLPYNLEKAKEQFKQAKLMLRAFEHWFGPYPFYEDGYKLVETPYLGMEHQSSVTYGNGYQNGYRGKDLSGTGWGLKWDFIIIHESGHEWFANNITYKDIADMWIHESFTNYSETLFTEYYYGKAAGTDYVVGTRKDIKNDIPIVGIYNVNKRGSGDMYPKGGNMLHTIRHSIDNDSLFREILRGLNKTFYHQTVDSRQVEDFISEKSGVDFSRVFDQYLRTVKIPELQYYRKGKRTYYRWANVVDNFDLQLVTSEQSFHQRLRPTLTWSKVKLKKNEVLIDKSYLERMYYIRVSEVAR
jgi:aminopeptidase N